MYTIIIIIIYLIGNGMLKRRVYVWYRNLVVSLELGGFFSGEWKKKHGYALAGYVCALCVYN